ncbi:MAG TPA: YncE family protein [Chitinophagaceae bacterium]|nr:YncE family protein [Chitinophagaceae bacterium]
MKDRIVYVAALGNNSVEVVDIIKGLVLHSIKAVDEPQGVAYIPQQQEIFIACGGNGDCYFYNANSFEKTATIHLSSDADDVRYDSTNKLIYVGYGEGGIAVIDAELHKQTGDIKLTGHPEGFQIDKRLNKVFINVPDVHQIAVADLSSFKVITTWNAVDYRSNFPLAIDTADHILFVGYRNPSRLVAMDEHSGTILAKANLVSDVDDIYFDEIERKIYASGGGGFITIYQWQKPEIKQIAKIATRIGARTSLLIPTFKLFILAARANGNNAAELQVYKTNQ